MESYIELKSTLITFLEIWNNYYLGEPHHYYYGDIEIL